MAQSMVLVSYSTVLSKIVSLDLLYMQVLLPHQCVGKLSKVCDPFLQKYSSAAWDQSDWELFWNRYPCLALLFCGVHLKIQNLNITCCWGEVWMRSKSN